MSNLTVGEIEDIRQTLISEIQVAIDKAERQLTGLSMEVTVTGTSFRQVGSSREYYTHSVDVRVSL